MDNYLYRKLSGQARQVSRSSTGSEKAGNLHCGVQNILSGQEQSKYLKKYKKETACQQTPHAVESNIFLDFCP